MIASLLAILDPGDEVALRDDRHFRL